MFQSEIDALEDVLDRAQHPRPRGLSDGSISPQLWTTLREYARARRQLLGAEAVVESWEERCLTEFDDG